MYVYCCPKLDSCLSGVQSSDCSKCPRHSFQRRRPHKHNPKSHLTMWLLAKPRHSFDYPRTVSSQLRAATTIYNELKRHLCIWVHPRAVKSMSSNHMQKHRHHMCKGVRQPSSKWNSLRSNDIFGRPAYRGASNGPTKNVVLDKHYFASTHYMT